MNSRLPLDFSNLPSKTGTISFVNDAFHFLFPHENEINGQAIHHLKDQQQLIAQLQRLLTMMQPRFVQDIDPLVNNFMSQLPRIKNELLEDADLFVESDPAVESIEEVVMAYPGFFAIAVYRISNALYHLNVPLLPRIISEYVHSKTGIDIHPGATIAVPFFIDHGTGVVIGQTAEVGSHVKIYQGVTLGALAVRKEAQGMKRHPTIGDRVTIYAGSCVLGGDTIIGHDTVIGGNVWLTRSVPSHSIVYHKSEVKIRENATIDEVIDFVI
ncbi:MAG: serine acetyltransferase [Chitinophagaceae bacterium]|nr:serine acetyltransferase [Chitinophagaceae bacterium]